MRLRRALPSADVSFVALVHLACFAAVYWLAFTLRFDFSIPAGWMQLLVATLPWILAVKLVVFYASGHCHGWGFSATFSDLMVLLRASLISLVLIVVIDYFIIVHQIPRAVVLMDCVMTIIVLGAVRTSGRLLREHVWPALRPKACRPALLIGVNGSTSLLAHQINSHAELGYRICGFLAESRRRNGRRIGQIPVLGHFSDILSIAARYHVQDVLVMVGTLSGRRMRRLMAVCKESGLTLKIIPSVANLFNGSRWIPLRDVEIDDLLRRTPVELDSQAIGELIRDRRVLVTGAGGSIGAEICRQVLRFRPVELVLLGRGENRIFAIERELQALQTPTILHPVIANITNENALRQVFEKCRPEIVFHAAAHKHVPLMKANVGEAVRNNTLGTRCVADLADEYDVKSFVLISTDKAVNPASVMGVTKHIAERYLQALSQRSATRFVIVRLGNVLGSAGSVVPIFQSQIRCGGPITVTDPRMTRYFMTIPEASQLVLQATAMGRGGEIFVLDMGAPVRIVDLASDLVRLSGLPADAIDVTYTGIRPGEKLEEKLCFDDEGLRATAHPKVHAAEHHFASFAELTRILAGLDSAVDGSESVLLSLLCEAVPEYRPHGGMMRCAPRGSGEICPTDPCCKSTGD
jgi:FlaA1/EpsC-like NDP-sugar epimerase